MPSIWPPPNWLDALGNPPIPNAFILARVMVTVSPTSAPSVVNPANTGSWLTINSWDCASAIIESRNWSYDTLPVTGAIVPRVPVPRAAKSASISTVTSSDNTLDQNSAARCTVCIAARLFCIAGPKLILILVVV